jgi:mono/diheme cytochrome c family protein
MKKYLTLTMMVAVVGFLIAGCNPQPLPVAPTPIPTLAPVSPRSVEVEPPSEPTAASGEEQPEGAQPEANRAEEGQQISQQTGCLACHSADGAALVGPTFKGLFGSERSFEDGSTGTADETYIRDSILNPGAQIVEGFANVMPTTYEQQLSEDQIEAIVDFVESLR